MHVVLAPDSSTGALPDTDVCRATATGVAAADPTATARAVPMADRGEGTPGPAPDAVRAGTRGTVEPAADALRHGARQVLVRVAGSATTDGGAGRDRREAPPLLAAVAEQVVRTHAGLQPAVPPRRA